MTLKIESPAELHADHRNWKSDISMWRFDLNNGDRNKNRHLNKSSRLLKPSGKTRIHSTSMQTRWTAIEAGLEFHEKNLAASLQDHAELDLDESLLSAHVENSKKFDSQREAHERLKKRHHIAVAQVAALKHALDAAM